MLLRNCLLKVFHDIHLPLTQLRREVCRPCNLRLGKYCNTNNRQQINYKTLLKYVGVEQYFYLHNCTWGRFSYDNQTESSSILTLSKHASDDNCKVFIYRTSTVLIQSIKLGFLLLKLAMFKKNNLYLQRCNIIRMYVITIMDHLCKWTVFYTIR